LCAIAAPGEVLASDAVVHLAQHVDGLNFVAARPARLKGFDRPITHVQVVPEEPLPPLPPPPAQPALDARRRKRRGAVALAIALLVAGGAWSVLHEGKSTSTVTPTIRANSLVSINPRTDALKPVVRIALGSQPARLAFGDGHLWTYNGDSQTVYGVDAHTHSVTTQGIGLSPSDVTTSPSHVWITDPHANVLTDINATSPNIQKRIPLDSRPANPVFAYTGPYQITAEHQRIWVAHQTGFVVVDGNRDQVITPPHHQLPPGHLGPADVAIQGDQRWYAVFGHPPKVVEAAPQHGSVTTTQSATCCGDLAIGFGYTWYASGHHVWKISPAPVSVADVIAVPEDGEAIAIGAGSVWVADTAAGEVLKIDPTTDKVTHIKIGRPLGGIASGAGLIWVTVQGTG
jgi:streptogramin lyase